MFPRSWFAAVYFESHYFAQSVALVVYPTWHIHAEPVGAQFFLEAIGPQYFGEADS